MALAIGLGLSPAAGVATGDGWVAVKHENGVSIETRDVPGSPVREIRAKALIRGSVEALGSLLQDISRRPEWDPTLRSARLLTDAGGRHLVYMQIELPWPAKDRDVVFRMSVEDAKSAGYIRILGQATDGTELPTDPRFVRITDASESWDLRACGANVVQVEMVTHVDPAGIPAWLVNAMSVDVPMSMLQRQGALLSGEKKVDRDRPVLVESIQCE